MEKLNALKKLLTNNRGVTLVEILAVLVLISIVFILADSMHLFGLNQYNVQTKSIQNQSQVRLAMTLLTRQIRSAQKVVVDDNNTPDNPMDNKLDIINSSKTDTYTLNTQDHTIEKNATLLIRNIAQFEVTQNGNEITLTLVSLSDKQSKPVERSTNLFIRE